MQALFDIGEKVKTRVIEHHGAVVARALALLESRVVVAEAMPCSYAAGLYVYVDSKITKHHLTRRLDDADPLGKAWLDLNKRWHDVGDRIERIHSKMYDAVCGGCPSCKSRSKPWPKGTKFFATASAMIAQSKMTLDFESYSPQPFTNARDGWLTCPGNAAVTLPKNAPKNVAQIPAAHYSGGFTEHRRSDEEMHNHGFSTNDNDHRFWYEWTNPHGVKFDLGDMAENPKVRSWMIDKRHHSGAAIVIGPYRGVREDIYRENFYERLNPNDRRIVVISDYHDIRRTEGLSRDTPWFYQYMEFPEFTHREEAFAILRARFGEPQETLRDALQHLDLSISRPR